MKIFKETDFSFSCLNFTNGCYHKALKSLWRAKFLERGIWCATGNSWGYDRAWTSVQRPEVQWKFWWAWFSWALEIYWKEFSNGKNFKISKTASDVWAAPKTRLFWRIRINFVGLNWISRIIRTKLEIFRSDIWFVELNSSF